MKPLREIGKFLLVALAMSCGLAVAAYFRYYPRDTFESTEVVPARTCVVALHLLLNRAEDVRIEFTSSSAPVDVYAVLSDRRSDREFAESEGLIALRQNQPPTGLLASQTASAAGSLRFSRAEGIFYRVLIVNRSQTPTDVRMTFVGKAILKVLDVDITLP